MAKKTRKKSRSKARKKSVARARKKAKPARRKAARKKKATGKIAGAYRTVVDSFQGTDRLRNKMEQPGTSESE